MWLGASSILARSSRLVARSFGGWDDVQEGCVGGRRACGLGVARGRRGPGGPQAGSLCHRKRGRGAGGGHAQASLERGTRGAGGGLGGWDVWEGWKTCHASRVIGKLRATSHELRARRGEATGCKSQASGAKPGSSVSPFGSSGHGPRPSCHASRVTRHDPRVTRQEEGEGARADGGPMGTSAPPGTDGGRRKWGKRAGVPPFFFKRGGGARSRRTYGAGGRRP